LREHSSRLSRKDKNGKFGAMFNESPLFYVLIVGIIVSFCALLVLHLYFRVRVFKAYKVLVQNRVDIDVKAIFNKQKIREEVLPRYPQFQREIWAFVRNLRLAMTLASAFLVLIILLGLVLLNYRS